MTITLLSNFARVNKRSPCPCCEKHDWCLIGKPGTEFDGAVLCKRIESPHRFGEAGWLHRPGGRDRPRRDRLPVVLKLGRSTPGSSAMALLAESAIRGLNPASLHALSN